MPGHRPSLRRAVSAAACVIRVACAVLLGACTTPVYEGFTDPSFTYPLVRSGGLLVGGVASSIDPLPARIADREAELLAAAIRSERPGLPVQTAALADPRFTVAGKQLQDIPAVATSTGPVVGPLLEIRTAVAEGVAKILNGEDVTATLAEMESQANALITDYNERNPG